MTRKFLIPKGILLPRNAHSKKADAGVRQTSRYPQCLLICLLMTAAILLGGCAHHFAVRPDAPVTAYSVHSQSQNSAIRWAPVFITHDHDEKYNRIGRPVAESDKGGNTDIHVDPEQPVIYFMERRFHTDKATYTNLIYRIHFPKVPFSLVPFHLTAGKNVGLMVVVTLDTAGHPVLVTTVHTCGCYKAIVPTDYLPKDALPADWNGKSISAFGEQLPARLDYDKATSARLLVHLRPGVHRVMDLEVISATQLRSSRFRVIPMPVEKMELLNRLPIDRKITSFFYKTGLMGGHVKGSLKPFELLFLSLPSLDLFVGSDKIYADPDVTGIHFYTSLKPWRREASDMWDFASFLDYWGWRL